MNKFLLSLSFITLLAGCDRPVENKTAEPKAPVNQPAQQSAVETSTENDPAELMAPGTVDRPASVEVIDATTELTMAASLDMMVVSLSDSEKQAFTEAFMLYAMSQVDMALDEETNLKNMLAALHGKSVSDIMDAADNIKAESNSGEAD